MATEHFCLRWNNHQSTLVSVFDNLLESGTLVDCTLAADGRYLKAHKVVLSACSPYLGVLLSQHHDKHPIIILKDVKFEELKAMLDYMYRGEVNISQEQLTTFLKAAESLQIKGLTDTGGEEGLQPIRPPSSNSTVSANNDEPPSPADGGSPSRKRKRNRTLDEMPDCETKLTISDSGSEKGRDVSVSSVGANVTKTSVGVKREVMDGEGDGQMSVDDSGDSALMSRPGPSNGGSTNNKGSPWLASDNSEDMQMTPSQDDKPKQKSEIEQVNIKEEQFSKNKNFETELEIKPEPLSEDNTSEFVNFPTEQVDEDSNSSNDGYCTSQIFVKDPLQDDMIIPEIIMKPESTEEESADESSRERRLTRSKSLSMQTTQEEKQPNAILKTLLNPSQIFQSGKFACKKKSLQFRKILPAPQTSKEDNNSSGNTQQKSKKDACSIMNVPCNPVRTKRPNFVPVSGNTQTTSSVSTVSLPAQSQFTISSSLLQTSPQVSSSQANPIVIQPQVSSTQANSIIIQPQASIAQSSPLMIQASSSMAQSSSIMIRPQSTSLAQANPIIIQPQASSSQANPLMIQPQMSSPMMIQPQISSSAGQFPQFVSSDANIFLKNTSGQVLLPGVTGDPKFLHPSMVAIGSMSVPHQNSLVQNLTLPQTSSSLNISSVNPTVPAYRNLVPTVPRGEKTILNWEGKKSGRATRGDVAPPTKHVKILPKPSPN